MMSQTPKKSNKLLDNDNLSECKNLLKIYLAVRMLY